MCNCPDHCCVATEQDIPRADCKGNVHNEEASLGAAEDRLRAYQKQGRAVTSPCWKGGSTATGNGFLPPRVSPYPSDEDPTVH